MIDLRTFLSSLVADTAKGQAQADHITAEIAEIYREHDLLKYFSVPKISISSIDFECNLAITGYKDELQIPQEAGDKFKSEISTYINNELYNLPETKAMLSASNIKETMTQKVKSSYKISEAAHKILDNVGVEYFLSNDFHNSMAPALSEKITGELVNALKLPVSDNQTHINRITVTVKEKIQQYTKMWWDRYVLLNPQLVKHKIPLIAVQSNELTDVPAEKMTKANIHLEIRPYEWTSMEVEDDNQKKTIKYKLVPE